MLGHPVVDCDGHLLEPTELLTEFLAEQAGSRAAARRILLAAGRQMSAGNPAAMQPMTGSWLIPNRARDIATAMAPALRAGRGGELGIDFHIVYPSIGLAFAGLPDPDFRLPGVRAINKMNAELCREHAGHLTPAALIPMHTPTEAVAELSYVKAELGFKAAVIPPLVPRPIPAFQSAFPRVSWLDSYGIDSAYDYDPVWAKFIELKMAVTSHGGVVNSLPFGWDSRSNYVFNHIGAHRFQQEHLCKSLLLGGVPARFPQLNFAFLECGALWACDVLQSLIDHYGKRGPVGISQLDPSRTDRGELAKLLEEYGGPTFTSSIQLASGRAADTAHPGTPASDFDHAQLTSSDDLIEMFSRFYFGCEADDRGVAVALDPAGIFGVRLRAVFGSDIGHWDVPDATAVVPESYELVETSALQLEGYRDFVLRHAVLLHGQMNSDFFTGTTIEDQAAKILRTAEIGVA
ncbi:MAG TPA: amidohydrolase family protein [Streptosporangiaceae bacterium]